MLRKLLKQLKMKLRLRLRKLGAQSLQKQRKVMLRSTLTVT